MKKLYLILFCIFITISGCKEAKESVRETKKTVDDYSKGLVETPKKTEVLTEIARIRQAIKMYQVQNGEYPEELKDLSIKIKNPDEYKYDSKTGKVKSKHYPHL